MAKRKKRAATSRSSLKKRRPVKRRTTAKRRTTGKRALLQNANNSETADKLQTLSGCEAPTDC